jgi:hypothetical protein
MYQPLKQSFLQICKTFSHQLKNINVLIMKHNINIFGKLMKIYQIIKLFNINLRS